MYKDKKINDNRPDEIIIISKIIIKYSKASLIKQLTSNPQKMLKSPLILFLTMLTLTIQQTDLSTNNCPSDFNITQVNVTTGIGTSDIATFFFSTYMGQSQK
jgi:hypothetical protein